MKFLEWAKEYEEVQDKDYDDMLEMEKKNSSSLLQGTLNEFLVRKDIVDFLLGSSHSSDDIMRQVKYVCSLISNDRSFSSSGEYFEMLFLDDFFPSFNVM